METERKEHIDIGCTVTVKSKRGTGTRDQDEIKIESNHESLPSQDTVGQILDRLYQSMKEARNMDLTENED